MRVFGITVCHMDPDIIAFSLNKVRMTFGWDYPQDQWLLLDNRWPLHEETAADFLNSLYEQKIYDLFRVPKNLGGLGGFNRGLEILNGSYKLQDDDLIFGIDPDTNPLTLGWGDALIEAMETDKSLDAVSLMIKSLKPHRPWRDYDGHPQPHKLVKHFDMYNATCWRYRAIKDGLKANLGQYYGGVELGMRHLNHAYLYDFEEDHCPIPHPQCYNDWKRKHAFEGYKGNFDQYVKEFHPELLG